MEKLGIEVSSVSLTDESAIESLVLDKGGKSNVDMLSQK